MRENSTVSILHIDDDEIFLDLAKTYIEMLDKRLKVTPVNNPYSALEILQSQRFDVIVSDYEMPELNGLELFEKIKEQNIKAPFIVLTGRSREEVAIQALNIGVYFYVQKSLKPNIMFKELIHYIRIAHNEQKALEEKELMQNQLIESEKRYKNLFERANIGIVQCTIEGEIIDFNNNIAELLEERELERVNFASFIIEEEREKFQVALKQLQEKEFIVMS